MKKIYLASPFFNEIESMRVEAVKTVLRGRGFEVFVPNEHQNTHLTFGEKPWRKATWQGDMEGIHNSDIVVAIISSGNYSDDGTAWECGYAFAKNMPIIVLNLNEGEVAVNLMISDSLHAYLDSIEKLKSYDFDTMPKITYDKYVW